MKFSIWRLVDKPEYKSTEVARVAALKVAAMVCVELARADEDGESYFALRYNRGRKNGSETLGIYLGNRPACHSLAPKDFERQCQGKLDELFAKEARTKRHIAFVRRFCPTSKDQASYELSRALRDVLYDDTVFRQELFAENYPAAETRAAEMGILPLDGTQEGRAA